MLKFILSGAENGPQPTAMQCQDRQATHQQEVTLLPFFSDWLCLLITSQIPYFLRMNKISPQTIFFIYFVVRACNMIIL